MFLKKLLRIEQRSGKEECVGVGESAGRGGVEINLDYEFAVF